MNRLKLKLCTILFIVPFINSVSQVTISNAESGGNTFPLISPSHKAAIYYDDADDLVVKKVAELFRDDVCNVTGKRPEILEKLSSKHDYVVVVGTIGKNAIIDKLIASNRIDTRSIAGGWEQYVIQLVDNPTPKIKKALVVAGCDRRGTVYGLFSVSEVIGVSPWYWWADVPVRKRTDLNLKVNTFSSKSPSVKYRGIFINDEDWGLKPWASKTFEPEVGDIGPKTYAKICELLLRVKANYLSPAMHSCTKAFNYYPDNKLVADTFGIVMGSIHCEPLLFNNASEWDKETMGEWNYLKNRDGINRVLRERVRANGRFENVYTLAMRGIHDAVMAGNLKLEQQAKVLERAFADQRQILAEETGMPVEEIPQVFYPYKEVLNTYEHGMNLPDDVTLVWSNDDFGYMKRLSNAEEQKRSGRAGVYYHVSYWGPPNHNLWITTTPPALIYTELKKAYDTTADRLWVVNVGDIKPAEYHISLIMDMAYDIDRFNIDNINDHHADFLCRIFGEQYRKELKDISQHYFHLAYSRKPEAVLPYQDNEYSVFNYREIDRRLNAYGEIGEKAEKILKSLPPESVPAFYQLVYYNVRGAELINKMHLTGQKSRWYATQGRATVDKLNEEVKMYGDSAERITEGYNTLLNGKWNHTMSLIHAGNRTFHRPTLGKVDLLPKPTLGVGAEEGGGETGMNNWSGLPCFNVFTKKTYHFDVFNKGQGTLKWKAATSEPWIVISKKAGNTRTEDRVEVSINWDKVPKGEHIRGIIRLTSNGGDEEVYVSVFNPASPTVEELKGIYVEDNGYISIDAAGYHREKTSEDISFQTITGLGLENQVVQLGDVFARNRYFAGLELTSNYVAPVRDDRYPRIEYDFYTFKGGLIDVYTYMAPTFPLDKDTELHGARYGVMVDNSPVFLPEAWAEYYSTPWIQSILKNCRVNKTSHYINGPGKHTLKIYCAHPGVMLQKVVIDTGGLKRSSNGPEPTKVK